MVEIQPYIQKMADRFADPNIQQSFKGFTKTLLFKFTDTKEEWVLKAVDGSSATVAKESPASADVTITTTTDVLAGIMDKKINGTMAYMTRKLQVKGAMEDLMKLQKNKIQTMKMSILNQCTQSKKVTFLDLLFY